jgi:hypothetical protein
MQGVIKLTLGAVIALSCNSCRRSARVSEYVTYINDSRNGLKKAVVIDGWEYDFLYRPNEYVALVENNGIARREALEKRNGDLKGTVSFNISLKRKDNSVSPLRYEVTSIEQYNDRLTYYLTSASKDIRLIYGTDTLAPSNYIFENNYNLTPQQTMVLAFNLPKGEVKPTKDMRISITDRVFKNGIINAEYPIATLNQIPSLVY